jgi:hypothetical protein
MKRPLPLFVLLLVLALPPRAHSFCGFYVASGDSKLYNHSSQVVLVRNDDHTVLTMASDYKGDPKEFAIVVPVPTVLEKGQVHIGDKALVEHLDAYSAPRLVEYFDPDPCQQAQAPHFMLSAPASKMLDEAVVRGGNRALGVQVEAQYTVGEYDIVILSATQSGGLETWLKSSGYRIPDGASRVLGSYIKQGMKFFVAKVNLKEQKALGFASLRPIQVAYDSPKFMLPIRLGMVNADGPQELFVYALSRKGRVETTNYRTIKLPSDMDVPEYVKDRFADFYRAVVVEQSRKNDGQAIFTEYAWDMSWCDPCASPPLSNEELKGLGVFWLDESEARMSRVAGQPNSVFMTRLHVRYDRAHFPEDLVFQETADRENYQARYVLRHPWKGAADCEAANAYRAQLRARREKEAQNLADLTGWRLGSIRSSMNVGADWSAPTDHLTWWQRLWQK